MIFSPDMLQAVLEGRKTQTRRPVDSKLDISSKMHDGTILCVRRNGFVKWRSAMSDPWNRVAIQPGRGKHRVGQIHITTIRTERVCDITDEDARAEGFADREGYFAKWRELYGDKADMTAWVWVLTFELVEGGEL